MLRGNCWLRLCGCAYLYFPVAEFFVQVVGAALVGLVIWELAERFGSPTSSTSATCSPQVVVPRCGFHVVGAKGVLGCKHLRRGGQSSLYEVGKLLFGRLRTLRHTFGHDDTVSWPALVEKERGDGFE